MLWNVTTAEYLHAGHMACPGCGASLSLRHVLKILGEQTIVVLPACCTSIIVGGQPTTAVAVCHFSMFLLPRPPPVLPECGGPYWPRDGGR